MPRSSDVAATLDELDRKLRRLEAELRGHSGAVEGAAPGEGHPPPDPDGLLRETEERLRAVSGRIDGLLALRDDLQRAVAGLVAEYEQLAATLAAPPAPEDTVLEGDVVVVAGPVADVAALVALEQALRAVPAVARAAVRTFDGGRAVADVRLAAPAALGRELRATSRAPLVVAVAQPGELVVELGRSPGQPAG